MSVKFLNLLQAPWWHTYGHMTVYGELPSFWVSDDSDRQGCCTSPFLRDFSMADIMKNGLGNLQGVGFELADNEKL